jgi:hypothetical protein
MAGRRYTDVFLFKFASQVALGERVSQHATWVKE